jgi:hypothetical protein
MSKLWKIPPYIAYMESHKLCGPFFYLLVVVVSEYGTHNPIYPMGGSKAQ